MWPSIFLPAAKVDNNLVLPVAGKRLVWHPGDEFRWRVFKWRHREICRLITWNAIGYEGGGTHQMKRPLLALLFAIFLCSTARSTFAQSIEVMDFCTANVGATDNTACVQRAIGQAGSKGGGRVLFAPGTYLFKGTLNLNASNIVLDCGDMAAILNFDNGASDDIRTGFQPVVIAHPGIRGCWFTHPPTKTGGVSLRYYDVFGGITENVQIDNPYDGIEVENFNTMKWNSIYLATLQDHSGNGFGMKFFRNANLKPTPQFGDVAIITNSIIACGDSGAFSMTGVAMDGIGTLDMTHVGILQCSTGLWIENSAGNDPKNSPTAFGNFNSLEIDGAHYIGLRIDSGVDLKFQGCSVWGGVRGLNITSDTTLVTFSGGRIGGATEQAAVIDGTDITFSGTVFTASSLSGSFPMIELASHASHVLFNGVRSGPNPINLNGTSTASYGLRIDPGADYAIVQGSDLSGNVLGGIFGSASHQVIANNSSN
jgi:Pectate lyase superfamily protein